MSSDVPSESCSVDSLHASVLQTSVPQGAAHALAYMMFARTRVAVLEGEALRMFASSADTCQECKDLIPIRQEAPSTQQPGNVVCR